MTESKPGVRVLTSLPTVTADGMTVTLPGQPGRLFVAIVELGTADNPCLIRVVWPPRSGTGNNHVYVTFWKLRAILRRIGREGLIANVRKAGYTFVPGDAEVDLYLFREDVAEAEALLKKRKFKLAVEAARRATDRWLGYPPLVMPGTREMCRRAFAIQIEGCEARGDAPQERTVWEKARAVLTSEDSEMLTQEVDRDRRDAAAKKPKRSGAKPEGGDTVD